jgi:uncharacterized membrane protein YbhN (UPF0104 family)
MTGVSSSRLRRAEFHVVLSMFLFVVVMAVVSIVLGGKEVLSQLQAVSSTVVCGMLLLSLVNYVTRALRWQMFTTHLGMTVPFGRTLTYYFAGFAMTTTPGKLGEAARLWFMERAHGYDYARIAPLFLGDRVSDLNAMVALCVLGMTAFSGYGWAVIILVVLGMLFTLLFMRPRLLLDLVGRAYLLAGRRWPRLFGRARRTVRLTAELFDLRTLGAATFLSVFGWIAECIAFAWLLDSLGAPVGLQGAMFVFAFSMLAGAVSMLPGGLGGVEAVMLALLVVAGTPIEIALVATIIIRVTTLWFAVGLGFVTLPLAMRHARRAHATAPKT